MKKIDPIVPLARMEACQSVDGLLKVCVRLLDEQGCRQASKYVRRCRKSVQGALRHATRLHHESLEQLRQTETTRH